MEAKSYFDFFILKTEFYLAIVFKIREPLTVFFSLFTFDSL